MSATLVKKGNKEMPKENDKEQPKPKIPLDILIKFINERVSEEDKKKVFWREDSFLWEVNTVERHRVNLWMRESVDGQYCDRTYIGHSWFIHFHKDTKQIVDKTIVQEKSDGKKYHY